VRFDWPMVGHVAILVAVPLGLASGATAGEKRGQIQVRW
jgi:hypothetical protein